MFNSDCTMGRLELFMCCASLLQQLVDLRGELSKLLRSDVQEQKSRLREAQSAAATKNDATAEIDSDVSDWLSDCADGDTIQKVEGCL